MIKDLVSCVSRKWTSGQRKSVLPYHAVTGRDMENYFSQVRAMCSPLANPFCYYEELIYALRAIPFIDILPASDFAKERAEGRSLLCLRHDIDSDPITALRSARFLASLGVGGSFYLLHTSPYYAEPYNGVVIRNPELVGWIKGFIVSGCEVGLHNDALGVQLNWRMDGAAALREELAWLRSQGLNIRGTVAHNSGPVYGAENYEIFSGRVLWPRRVRSPQGALVPQAVLVEQHLNLSYEGTFAQPKREPDMAAAEAFFADRASANIRSETWMKVYLLENPACDWAVDIQCWLLGKDLWVIAGRCHGAVIFEWSVGFDQLIYLLQRLPIGLRILLVTHPEYFSG